MVAGAAAMASDARLSGIQIMEEVYRRHEQFPYIYEEQVMILIDSAGNRDTRKLRRYSRLDSRDSGHYLLLFDDPPASLAYTKSRPIAAQGTFEGWESG